MGNASQQDYVIDVLTRKYCRTVEENEILYEEIHHFEETLKLLFQENADLRYIIKEAGLELPPSQFLILDEDQLEEMEESITP